MRIPTDPHTITTTDIKTNMCHIHTSIVSRHLATRGNNKILRTPPPHINSSEEIVPRLTPDPAEYTSYLELTINNTAPPMARHPKVWGPTLDRNSHTTHTFTTSQYTHTAPTHNKNTHCNRMGYTAETLMATYKAVMRQALEYASSIIDQH